MGPLRLGLGFGLDAEEYPAPSPHAMHWGGYGGSWAFFDPVNRVGMAYVMNKCYEGVISDPRQDDFWQLYRRELA